MPQDNGIEIIPAAVVAVREVSKAGLFKREGVTVEQKSDMLLELSRKIIAAYNEAQGTTWPEINSVRIDPNFAHKSRYVEATSNIIVDKPSLTSFLHALGLHLSKQRRGGLSLQSVEDAARWSLSLFSQALPRTFEAARQAGRLVYARPA